MHHILIRMLFFACGILITTSCPVRAFIPLWSLVNQFTSSGLFSAVDSMFAFMIELTVSFGTLSSISAIMIELTVSFGTLSSILAIFDSRLLACGVLRIIDVSAIRVNWLASWSVTLSSKRTVYSTFKAFVILWMLVSTSRRGVLVSAIISKSTNFVGAFHIKVKTFNDYIPPQL